MKTNQEKLDNLNKMEQANLRAEKIMDNLLSEGGLTKHQVLDALVVALICAAHDCEAPKDAFFHTLNNAWDSISDDIEQFKDENISIH